MIAFGWLNYQYLSCNGGSYPAHNFPKMEVKVMMMIMMTISNPLYVRLTCHPINTKLKLILINISWLVGTCQGIWLFKCKWFFFYSKLQLL